MNAKPEKISLEQWDARYDALTTLGGAQQSYGGKLSRHITDGDTRLLKLKYDNSPASLQLWNFLLTEEDRLYDARKQVKKIVGTMKDLGTVPVMAYSLSNVVAFYPDGAWWIPCVMELNAGLEGIASSLGIDESFCPVRAMLGAFVNEAHFPIPDLLTCSVGATCDDFSAIAQRLNGLGYPILWWEMPQRRHPDAGEDFVKLPGGFKAPKSQVEFVKSELSRVKEALENLTGESLDDDKLSAGIAKANEIRRILSELRTLVFASEICPLPALEMLIAEMLAIHYCSDRDECAIVLNNLLDEVKKRIESNEGVLPPDAVKVFWVNPVADLRAMNLLEDCGGRICGTDYLFAHALDFIPDDIEPIEALAMMALADPMVGSSSDRALRICADIQQFGAEALIISRIPGASHCAYEGTIIGETVKERLGIPVVEIEVPSLIDSFVPGLKTRIEALIETVKERRK